MKLMIVDDNHQIRSVIKSMLTRHLHNVESIYECSDGHDAVKLYRSAQPDWVLMDIQLKGLDGLMVTKRIIQENPDAKVVILTQYNDQVYREEAKNVGAYDYVLKENLHHLPSILTKHY